MAGGMQIASLFATIGADTSGLQKGLGGAKTSLEGLGSSMAKQVLGTVSLMGALAAVGKFVSSSVTDWADYADSMRLSAQMAGVTTEEMSKLVQAADDFRVPVETMQKSMEMALKNGFVPTIDNLAILSDQLLAIKDPAERAAAASKIFGKSYADMMPFLLAGGAAIRGATEAIADNLIVTAEGAAEAKEYKDQLDALGDAWTGLKNNVGQVTLPILIKIITAANAGVENEALLDQFRTLDAELYKVGITTHGLTSSYSTLAGKIFGVVDVDEALITSMKDVEKWASATTKSFREQGYDVESAEKATAALFKTYGLGVATSDRWSDANDRVYDGLTDIGEAVQLTAEEFEAAAKQSAEFMSSFANITSFTSGFGTITGLANSYDDILVEITAQEKIMAEEPTGSEKWLEAQGRIKELKGSMTDLANQITLDMFAAAIAINDVTETEMQAYLDMAVRMGETSKAGADAAMAEWLRATGFIKGLPIDPKTGNIFVNDAEYLAWVRRWKDYQPESKTAIITIERIEAGLPVYGPFKLPNPPRVNPGDYIPKAAGGPVSANTPYLVGERGPELFVPEGNGQIIPNGQTSKMMSGGGDQGGGGRAPMDLSDKSVRELAHALRVEFAAIL